MDANEPVPEATTPPDPFDDPPSLTPPGPSWRRGARTGFRRTSYVVAPLAAIPVLLGLMLAAFGVGAGRGFGLPPFFFNALAAFFLFGLFGALIGATLGRLRDARRASAPGTRPASFWARMNRPIYLFPERPHPDDAEPPPPRLRRWPWFVGVPIGLLLAGAVAAGIYADRLTDRRLADAVAAADRDDPHWRLDDLMAHREAVPDEENAALVVAHALEFLPETWPADPAPPPGHPSPPPTPAQEAYDRLGETPENVRLDDATAATLRDDIEVYGQALPIARSLAEHDRGRHELELGPTLLDTLLGETQAARGVARFLSADAALRAHDGDPDGALDSCRALLAVGRSIGDEPFLISQLVRVAIGGVALQSTRRVLGQGVPSDAALARLQALLLDEYAQPLLLHGLRGERAVMFELIRRIGAGELPIDALSGATFGPDEPRPGIAPWGRLLFDYQRALALEWLNEAVAIARRPAHERPPRWKALEDRIERTRTSPFAAYTSTLPVLLLPAVSAAHDAHARYQAQLGATAILLAAERHRLRHGDWPASVAEIATDLLPDPPLDPFAGRPFLMDRRDGQLLVHSIGPDGVDEHGAFEVRRYLRGGADDMGASAWDAPLRRLPPRAEEDPASPPSGPPG